MKGYIAYTKAKCDEYIDKLKYQVYVTDTLKMIAEGGYHQWKIEKRYTDLIFDISKKDTRDAIQIINDVIKKTHLEVTE